MTNLIKFTLIFHCTRSAVVIVFVIITILPEEVHADLFANPMYSSAQGSESHFCPCDNLHVTRESRYSVHFRVEVWVYAVGDIVADPHLLPIGLTNRRRCDFLVNVLVCL